MKYVHIIYSLFLLSVLLIACDDTEILENKIDFSSPYVIEDNPDDPIQHRRYLIFQKYGIPVFFNDTISKTFIYNDNDGKPVYRYETLDLNWSFSSHTNRAIQYTVDYYTDPELQMKGLEFIEVFLEQSSKPMRPFSIFLPSMLTIKDLNKNTIEKPEFWFGFRTLVIPKVPNMSIETIPSILLSMVKAKVMANADIISQFGEVSDKNKYYGKEWVAELGCKWGREHPGTYWGPTVLYKEGTCEEYIMWGFKTGINSVEDFEKERTIVFQQIGRFGFICGNYSKSLDHSNSPEKVDEDIAYYIDQMLEIGSEEFLRRYGESPLVVKKYTILANYINNVLGIEL